MTPHTKHRERVRKRQSGGEDLPSPALLSRGYGLIYPKKDKSVLPRLRVFSTWHNIKVSATVSNAPFPED